MTHEPSTAIPIPYEQLEANAHRLESRDDVDDESHEATEQDFTEEEDADGSEFEGDY